MSDDRRWSDRDRRGGWDYEDRGREGRGWGDRQEDDRGRSHGGRQGGGYGGAAFGGRDWDDRGWGDYGRGEDFGRRDDYGSRDTRGGGRTEWGRSGDWDYPRDMRPRDQERGWGGTDRDQWTASRGSAFGGQGDRDRDRYGAEEWRGYAGSQGYSGSQTYGGSQGFGRSSGYGGGSSAYGGTFGRDSRSGDYGREGQGDRSWFDKAGDEVSSWFGDRDAERRRREDQARGGDHRGRGPSGYRRSDERIREDVNDRLADDAWLDASGIEVQVHDGEVTLSGTVHDRNDKRHAEDVAERVSGVSHVQNNLRVKAPSGALHTAGSGRDMTGATTTPSTSQTSVGGQTGAFTAGAGTSTPAATSTASQAGLGASSATGSTTGQTGATAGRSKETL